uniref:Uncharacterized protein n=1 Tax=Rhizophora mucronata TaxID=61149 RepID=A0A2P2NWS7_RHIMU
MTITTSKSSHVLIQYTVYVQDPMKITALYLQPQCPLISMTTTY